MKKRIYIFILIALVFNCSLSFAQKNLIDSLQKMLLKETVDTTRCHILDELFWLYRLQQPEKTIPNAKEYFKITEKFDLSSQTSERLAVIRIDALLNYAIALSDNGQLDQAIEIGKQALDVATKFKIKRLRAICFNNLGEFYRMKSDYKIAIEYYIKSLKIKEEAGDRKGMGYTYHNIGNTYSRLNRHKEAVENFEKALNLREEVGHKKGMADTYSNMGASLISLGQDEKALRLYNNSIKIQRELGDSTGVANDLNKIAMYYEKIGNYNLALDFYKQAEKIYDNSGDEYLVGYVKIGMASSYSLIGNRKEAIFYALQAIDIEKN
jgi:tetratricopeptide (TPR) repeat protein